MRSKGLNFIDGITITSVNAIYILWAWEEFFTIHIPLGQRNILKKNTVCNPYVAAYTLSLLLILAYLPTYLSSLGKVKPLWVGAGGGWRLVLSPFFSSQTSRPPVPSTNTVQTTYSIPKKSLLNFS